MWWESRCIHSSTPIWKCIFCVSDFYFFPHLNFNIAIVHDIKTAASSPLYKDSKHRQRAAKFKLKRLFKVTSSLIKLRTTEKQMNLEHVLKSVCAESFLRLTSAVIEHRNVYLYLSMSVQKQNSFLSTLHCTRTSQTVRTGLTRESC